MFQPITPDQLATVYHSLMHTGGFTMRLADNSLATTGYAVARPGQFKTDPCVKIKFNDETFSPLLLQGLLKVAFDATMSYGLLADGTGLCLGAWIDTDGLLWLEPSFVYQSLRDAECIAVTENQKAIYSLHEGKEIVIGNVPPMWHKISPGLPAPYKASQAREQVALYVEGDYIVYVNVDDHVVIYRQNVPRALGRSHVLGAYCWAVGQVTD